MELNRRELTLCIGYWIKLVAHRMKLNWIDIEFTWYKLDEIIYK